ncbi:MAG: hypothetical protein WC285_01380 [Candidatus Gracilibacteria bacterium]|jgi:hypothetical protein
MRKTSNLLVVGILAVLLTASYTGYTFWQKSSAEIEVEKINYSLTEYKNKILKYEQDRVLQAVSAKQTLDNLKASNVEWSTVIRAIRNTLPKAEDGSDIVDVLSYSGSSNNDLSLTLKTVSGSENPFIDVAKLIAAFDKSTNFTGTFVPSIAIGEDKGGGNVLNFSMSTKYLKADVSQILSDEKTSR